MSKSIEANEKFAKKVVDGFSKAADKCVGTLFSKENECVETSKKRLFGEKE